MTASFRKGDLVRLSSHWSNSLKVSRRSTRLLGWRPLTSDERSEWYRAHREAVAAGEADPFDSAGETHLAPQYENVDVEPNGVWVVQRARCQARQGYHTVSGCAQLLDTKTGISFYIRREGLVPV
jgi:hypothetical protein